MAKIRVQKLFSDFGIMSRRAAEAEMEKGSITVNGVTVMPGDRADPEADIICYNGIQIKNGAAHRTYIMLNKPMGYVSTMSDEKGRHTAAELVADVGVRVYPVGRLDMYSEGLLLFTDDGELTNKLTHPSHDVPKKYLVKIRGAIPPEALEILGAPMELDGRKLRPVKIRVVREDAADRGGNEYTALQITLFEGRNRQIRRMCEKAGLSVMRLRRIAEGEIKLGGLESGKWRALGEAEISYLKSI